MKRQLFMAASTLAVVLMTGCAEFREHKDDFKADPAAASKFEGKWKAERKVFEKGAAVRSQAGTASGEMIGKNVRISSQEMKLELLFGIRKDGKYVLADANASRDRIMVGKYTDDEEEDGDAKEVNNDINLKFGEKVLGEIRFPSPDTVEIRYFRERGGKEATLEVLSLTRIR